MATLTPQTIEFAETAPFRAEGSAVVAGTPAEVWAVVLDYERWPDWFPGVKRCHATSTPPTGVGSTREVVLSGGSTFQERFIAWEDEALWSFTATEMKPPGFRSLVERLTIEDLGPNRSQVTYRMGLELTIGLKPLALLLRPMLNRTLTKAMAGLAAQVVSRR